MAEITLTIPDELLDAYIWFQGQNGPKWADAYVTEKLEELASRKIRFEKDEMKSKYDNLTTADKDKVKALLEKGK